MKLHGICLVKNEDDFVAMSLRHHLQWFDAIYVYDNGSMDRTWEIVSAMAREEPRIVPYKTEDRDFRDGLRADVFNHYRDRAAAGDWWCRLDADEIYLDSPREFLPRVRSCYQVVWSIAYQYYLIADDVAKWASREGQELENLGDLPRWYRGNASEPRFFRHRSRLEWRGSDAWPRHMGLVAPERIRLRHYQYRSPQQIQKRLATRQEATRRGYLTFGHGAASDWRDKVADKATCIYDEGGEPAHHERDLPRHLEPGPVRLAKRLLHGFGIWA
jgi:hypothetical protein